MQVLIFGWEPITFAGPYLHFLHCWRLHFSFFVLYSKTDTTPNCSDRHPICRNCGLYPEKVSGRTLPNQNAGQRRLAGTALAGSETYIADRNFEVTMRFLYWTSLFGRGNKHTRKQSYARTNEFRDRLIKRKRGRVVAFLLLLLSLLLLTLLFLLLLFQKHI